MTTFPEVTKDGKDLVDRRSIHWQLFLQIRPFVSKGIAQSKGKAKKKLEPTHTLSVYHYVCVHTVQRSPLSCMSGTQ